MQFRTHQIEAVEQLQNGTILRGSTGTGKSRVAMMYFYTKVCDGSMRINGTGKTTLPKKPVDIYVITTARKRDEMDWEKEAARFAITTNRKDSVSGIQLTVDSWQNIKKYKEVTGAFFIFDEQHISGSGVWVKTFLHMAKQNKWILLSATPGDTWLDYIPVFVANGFYKNRTEFIQTHVIYKSWSKFPKVDRYMATRKLERHLDEITVEMPFDSHTVRHLEDIVVDYDRDKYKRVWKDRWNIFENRPYKHRGEVEHGIRRVVNEDPSRTEAIAKLVTKHPRIIIFYTFDYELYALREMASELEILSAEWNGHRHEPTPTTDSWLYFVQYLSGASAWNCITTDTIVFYSMSYSYRTTEQARGRIDRMNTPYTDLYYYTLRSTAPIDIAIRRALREKRDFNALAFAKKQGYDLNIT